MASVIPKPNLPEPSMEWAKAITKLVTQHDDNIVVISEETARANDSAGNAVEQAGAAAEQGQAIIIDSLRQPAAPQEVTVSNSQAYFTTAGVAAASLVLSWIPTENDVTGDPIDVTQYEVWYKTALAPAKRYTSLTPPPGDALPILNPDDPAAVTNSYLPTVLVEGLDRNVLYTFTVRTKSIYGVWGPFSDPLDVTSAVAPPLLVAPSAPTLTSEMSTVIIKWDGKLNDGTPAPLYADYAQAYMSTTSTGTYAPIGQTIGSAGTTSASGLTPGQVRWFKLAITDRAGNISPLSTAVSITVLGVNLGSLGTDVSGAIDAANAAAAAATSTANSAATAAATATTTANSAVTIANGKNTVFFQTAAPSTTGRVDGDTWFDTDDDNRIYKWTAGAWTLAPLGNNAVSALDAAKINTGFLAAARIAANSISTQKLLVGNFNNLLEDPSFETGGSIAWTLPTNVTNVTTTPYTGLRALRVKASTAAYTASQHQMGIPVNQVPSPTNGVVAQEEYLLGGFIRAEGTTGVGIESGIELGFLWGLTDASTTTYVPVVGCPVLPANGPYQFFSGYAKIPLTAKFVRPVIKCNDITNVNVYLLDDLTFYQRVQGSLIVDGAITAEKIGSKEVKAGKIDAGAVTATEILGRTITADQIMGGTITGYEILGNTITGNHIMGGEITTDHLNSTFGADLDISSNTAINLIVGDGGAIDTVNGKVDGVQTSLEGTQAVYSFTEDGATISSSKSPYSIVISNTKISIMKGTTEVSWWDSQAMNVKSFIGEDVILGNHQISKSGTGTVVKAL